MTENSPLAQRGVELKRAATKKATDTAPTTVTDAEMTTQPQTEKRISADEAAEKGKEDK
jgi:hypothetical protein